MAMYMPWGERAAFENPAERRQLTAELSAFIPPGEPSGEKAPLASVADMVRQAQERWGADRVGRVTVTHPGDAARSEEHTSELQSLMRTSYAVFCLKQKKRQPKE